METLIGFLLFSSMMMLYLPAFYTEMSRLDKIIETSKKWHLFYDLSKVNIDEELGSDTKDTLSNELIYNWESLNNLSVTNFGCSALTCYISFEDGSELDVEVQAIT